MENRFIKNLDTALFNSSINLVSVTGKKLITFDFDECKILIHGNMELSEAARVLFQSVVNEMKPLSNWMHEMERAGDILGEMEQKGLINKRTKLGKELCTIIKECGYHKE
jgi:hypothetical protein